jgi:hypothetical protein
MHSRLICFLVAIAGLVGLLMIQTSNPNRQGDRNFENAVMQARIE